MAKREAGAPERRGGPKYYAVYRRDTDEMVCNGTARQCAAAMGRSMSAFYTIVTRARQGRNRKWEIYAEPMEEP